MLTLRLEPVSDLRPFLGAGTLVAFDVGSNRQLCMVTALKPTDLRDEIPGWASFPKTVPNEPQSYRVVMLHSGAILLDLVVPTERFNIHHIQPLPASEVLLACGRSHYRGPDDIDRNGRVYSSQGVLLRELVLGDGISGLHTTSAGVTWAGYFDEGVFGNFGWTQPIGASGLVAFDTSGTQLYSYQPPPGLERVDDCYALNVDADNSIWFRYYSSWPLVHLLDERVDAHWDLPARGNHAFAIRHPFVLFDSGYNRDDTFSLFKLLPSGTSRQVAKLALTDEADRPLKPDWVRGRFDVLYMLAGHKVYSLNVQQALDAKSTRWTSHQCSTPDAQ